MMKNIKNHDHLSWITKEMNDRMSLAQHQVQYKNRVGKWKYVFPATVTRDDPKVSRNAPCPCGSGKKYKKCHLNNNKTEGESK